MHLSFVDIRIAADITCDTFFLEQLVPRSLGFLQGFPFEHRHPGYLIHVSVFNSILPSRECYTTQRNILITQLHPKHV